MIYGLSDLHLDSTGDKSMEVFGEAWKDYENRIISNWNTIVEEDDLVLIPGDISWALKLEEALDDLRLIDSLPGKKILMKGNHDYWWKSLTKLKDLDLTSIDFLQNNSFEYKDISIAGTRGWSSRDSLGFSENDEGIFKRELIRLDLSLSSVEPGRDIIAMLHYPPFDRYFKPNEFGQILESYKVKTCVYGHLHAEGLRGVVEGKIGGIEYKCLSADFLNFMPKILY